jgi:hypothetical protein
MMFLCIYSKDNIETLEKMVKNFNATKPDFSAPAFLPEHLGQFLKVVPAKKNWQTRFLLAHFQNILQRENLGGSPDRL